VRLQVAGDIIANSIAGSSDLRFKTNITPIENPLQKVLQLRGVNFDWNKNAFPDRSFSESKAIGFIAQEVEKVLPEVVQTEKTAEGYKAVQYDKVVALLVEASYVPEKQNRCIKIVRKNAKEWKLDENKIGIIGFSAGGHLASTLATKFNEKTYTSTDTISARPDFTLLIYPVISMKNEITHSGSKTSLLGKQPSKSLIKRFSNEENITNQTPMAFIVHASDDKSVSVMNSINYYLALKEKKIDAELHLYEKGGHGFGLDSKETSQFWIIDCSNWLKKHNFL
jgi:predicted esterase